MQFEQTGDRRGASAILSYVAIAAVIAFAGYAATVANAPDEIWGYVATTGWVIVFAASLFRLGARGLWVLATAPLLLIQAPGHYIFILVICSAGGCVF